MPQLGFVFFAKVQGSLAIPVNQTGLVRGVL
jgi:hypothetical protein